ncbi:hypothetical protein BO94DRAFT_577909 [Aspergillus sclerotioniger CBS 115572]|uniref:Ecp2 effector protein domain-containing protein n=1 Tax=Aspergillus sclerotioniger CBS 115572 TaxID=1450535 RepID=A0A317VW27_9EURO|nr:hypothetical protein BO94DRAFT_577909 [Aspergillus sclerotioniger CBS 115572]PWY76130.1 hypothetical protein BO94DRAFT_577909 [Aspergillus sclerotioniger CBS 115572]
MHLPTLPLLTTTLTTLSLIPPPYPQSATPTPSPPAKTAPPSSASRTSTHSNTAITGGTSSTGTGTTSHQIIVGKTGTFDSIEDCLDGFQDVVETCHGEFVGGVLVGGNVSLDVHFCDW